MMIMPLREFDKMESSSKTANDQKVLWEALLEESMWLQQITHRILWKKRNPILKLLGGPFNMLLWQCLNPFIKEKSVLRKL
jgi:hypothetical protein